VSHGVVGLFLVVLQQINQSVATCFNKSLTIVRSSSLGWRVKSSLYFGDGSTRGTFTDLLSNRLETRSRLQGDWRLETKGLSVSSLQTAKGSNGNNFGHYRLVQSPKIEPILPG